MKVYNVRVLSAADGYWYCDQMLSSFSSLVRRISKSDTKYFKHVFLVSNDDEGNVIKKRIGTVIGAKYGKNVPLNIDVMYVDIDFDYPIDIEQYNTFCVGHISKGRFIDITCIVLYTKL